MNRLVKSIILPVVFLIIGFFVGRFYQHFTAGYHFEIRNDKVYTSDFGSVRWEYVTDSIGTPFLDTGTTRISFDDRLIYKAKCGFQENAPYAQNVTVDGDQINWDDGDYRYNLKITLSPESNTGEENAAHQALSRPDVKKSNFMFKPDTSEIMTFKSPKDLSKWLQANHASDSELWLKIFKKGSGVPSVTWNEVVIEALCWGWIDGIKKSVDDQAYLQRITPRKPRSNWSKRNTEHIERLIIEGRMEEPGLVPVRAAKADGRWENAYSASEMKVPADFLAALDNRPKAKQFYETLTKSNRYVIAYGLESAKKSETRQRRFKKFMDMLIREEKLDFGFKKDEKA